MKPGTIERRVAGFLKKGELMFSHYNCIIHHRRDSLISEESRGKFPFGYEKWE